MVHRQKNSTTTGSYRAGDIIYDIKNGHLAVEVTAEEAADEGADEADACRDSVRFEGSDGKRHALLSEEVLEPSNLKMENLAFRGTASDSSFVSSSARRW